MKNVLLFLSLLVAIVLCSCNSELKEEKSVPIISGAVASTGPNAIIYKTKADYNNLVPVILNDNKTKIVSFPAPRDLKYKGELAIPIQLADGFLLDNRGINSKVAFLDIRYDEYFAFSKTPSVEELMERILDKDPITAMYNCGKRQIFKNEVEELNALILANDFSKFRKLK